MTTQLLYPGEHEREVRVVELVNEGTDTPYRVEPHEHTWKVELPKHWPDAAILSGCSHRPGTLVTITDEDGTARRYKAAPKRRVTWLPDGPGSSYRRSSAVYFEEAK